MELSYIGLEKVADKYKDIIKDYDICRISNGLDYLTILVKHLQINGVKLNDGDMRCLGDIYEDFDNYLNIEMRFLHEIMHEHIDKYCFEAPYTFDDFIKFTTDYFHDAENTSKIYRDCYDCYDAYGCNVRIRDEFDALIKTHRDDLFKLYSKYMDTYHSDKNLPDAIKSRIKYYDELLLKEINNETNKDKLNENISKIINEKNEYINSVLNKELK